MATSREDLWEVVVAKRRFMSELRRQMEERRQPSEESASLARRVRELEARVEELETPREPESGGGAVSYLGF